MKRLLLTLVAEALVAAVTGIGLSHKVNRLAQALERTASATEQLVKIQKQGLNGTTIGRLEFDEKGMRFTGNADKSALEFFEYLKGYFEKYRICEEKKERHVFWEPAGGKP